LLTVAITGCAGARLAITTAARTVTACLSAGFDGGFLKVLIRFHSSYSFFFDADFQRLSSQLTQQLTIHYTLF
jgi:hypothetical protein